MRIGIVGLISLGLLALSSAVSAEAPWLKVPLSAEERLQLAQAGSDFGIRDAQNLPVAFALCPVLRATPPRPVELPLTALTRGTELLLSSDGSVHLRSAPGVSLQPPWERWVLDLRAYNSRLLSIVLPAQIDPETVSLRSSPNLQQWSRPLPFRLAQNGRLQFLNPLGADWLAIVFSDEPNFAPGVLRATLAADAPQRDRQWFPVTPDPDGVVNAPLPEPVRGVRVDNANPPLQQMQLASRIKPRDAWKARGRWQSGEAQPAILFNGVGDAQWRLNAIPKQGQRQWMLAHDRMEIRIASTPALPLKAVAEARPASLLACDAQRWSGPARTTALSFASWDPASRAQNDSSQTNLLPWFLALLAVLGILAYAQSRR